MNRKSKGRAGDNQAVKFLERFGLTNYTISAASIGVFDTIHWNDKCVVWVQNKKGKGSLIPDRNELLKMMYCQVPNNGLRLLLLWKHQARKPEIWFISNNEITEISIEKLQENIADASVTGNF